MTLKPGKTFWSIQGDFIYRHHNEPRVKLYVPKEETFPIRLKHIDATRATYTNLTCCKKKDDCWNVDANRSLSHSWKRFTTFTLLKENLRKDTCGPQLWPEVWTKIGKAAQKRQKQEWRNEKPQLDNARRLRGICFIGPEDGASNEVPKTKHACIVEALESTRQRLEPPPPKDHEDQIASKR